MRTCKTVFEGRRVSWDDDLLAGLPGNTGHEGILVYCYVTPTDHSESLSLQIESNSCYSASASCPAFASNRLISTKFESGDSSAITIGIYSLTGKRVQTALTGKEGWSSARAGVA